MIAEGRAEPEPEPEPEAEAVAVPQQAALRLSLKPGVPYVVPDVRRPFPWATTGVEQLTQPRAHAGAALAAGLSSFHRAGASRTVGDILRLLPLGGLSFHGCVARLAP